jgi:hypothetical protein
MCFSAPVSFIAAAGTGAVGALLARRAKNGQDLALAAFPLTFAAQQAVEGALWLQLGAHEGTCAGPLANGFLFFALLLWPVLAPVAALIAEPSKIRRRIMLACLAVGVGVTIHMIVMMITHPYEAIARGGSISYVNDVNYSRAIEAAYGAAVCVPLLASSKRKVVVFGGLVVAGAAASYLVFAHARVSVWCFFAALASLSLIGWPLFPPRAHSDGETPKPECSA